MHAIRPFFPTARGEPHQPHHRRVLVSHICMRLCMYACLAACLSVCLAGWLYVCMYVHMYVWVYGQGRARQDRVVHVHVYVTFMCM